MAKLQIHVHNDGGKTVSKFEVTDTEKVVFINKGGDEMTIALKLGIPPPGPVLCEGRNDKNPVSNFTVPAGGRKAVFVCDSFQGNSFAYMAQIKNTTLEDPIVIIEKSRFFQTVAENLPVLGLGVIAGILATLIAQRLFRRPGPA